MNNVNIDTINAGLFPISFNAHIVFTVVSVLFFLMQYTKNKHLYQLLCAIAIPLPLILYVNSSSVVYYLIGAIELVLVVIISILLFSTSKKEDEKNKADKQNLKKSQKESNNNET